MKINLLFAMFALFFCTLSTSQNPRPNSSFENWTDNQPDEWDTSNFPGFFCNNVTRTSPDYTLNLLEGGSILPINVDTFSNGIYFCHFSTSTNTIIKPFITSRH